MKPIRIAHITTIDFSLRHLLLNQLLHLKDRGFDVTGISSSGPDVELLERHGIRHIAVPMACGMTPLRDLASLYRLYSVLKKEKFDLVHTHNPKPGLLGQIAARMAGIPYVINTLHGFYFHDQMPLPQRRLYITLEKIAGRCSDAILSQNFEDVRTALDEGVCLADQITYLGNGIDLDYFNPNNVRPESLDALRGEFGVPKESLVVGFVGRLVEEKGIRELLDAAWCAKRNDIDVRFLFIGPLETEKKNSLTPAIAKKYDVEEICIFTGLRYDMPELYALMDLFVLPSYREGFPPSPMEAAAMGVPVIVSDIRGCREAVVDGENGVLVPARSSARLATALLDLLDNPAERKRLSNNARRIAEERYDELIVFDRISDEYNRLTGGGANGRSHQAVAIKHSSELSRRSAEALAT